MSDRTKMVHIQERIGLILEFTSAGREDFLDSFIIQDAVLRNFDVNGESVKQIFVQPLLPLNRTSGSPTTSARARPSIQREVRRHRTLHRRRLLQSASSPCLPSTNVPASRMCVPRLPRKA